MAPPSLVVAVVGSHEHPTSDDETRAWVAARDITWSGSWLALDCGGRISAAAADGARQHRGTILAFASHEYRSIDAHTAGVSLVVHTGLPSPLHATVLAANADALLAFAGDAKTMAAIAAAHERGIPVAQIGTLDWPARPLNPTEVPAWLENLAAGRGADPPNRPDPPPAPDLTTQASGSGPVESTPSSSSTADDATSSESPTTPTNEPASTPSTPTE